MSVTEYRVRCPNCGQSHSMFMAVPEHVEAERDRYRIALKRILDEQDTEWATDPSDMSQRYVASVYAKKLGHIFEAARAALKGEQ